MAKKRKYTKRNTKRRYHKRRNTKRRVRTNQRGGATLEEFKARYVETHAQALAEIKVGKKSGCWSWWIWPVSNRDLRNGSSAQRKKYALTDSEARDFLSNEYLRNKWLEIMIAVYTQLIGGINYKILATGTNQIDDSWCLIATCNLFQGITSVTNYPVVNNVCTQILGVIQQQVDHHKAGQRKATSGPGSNGEMLINMGFSPADVGNALLKTNGDVQLAADLLLSGAVSSFPTGGATGGATGRPDRPSRTPCMYGHECYNKTQHHRNRYSHPGNSDWPSTMAAPRGATPGPRHGAAGGPDPGRAKAGGNQVIITKQFSQAAAYEEKSQRGFTTGILIAGNAGLPGGDLGKKNGPGGSKILDGSGTFWSEPRFYATQEESVVNSWFHATKLLNRNVQKVFRHNIGDKSQGPDGRPWGLRYTDVPLSSNEINSQGIRKSTATLQGHNYTESFNDRDPGDHIIKYAFCHPVRDQQIAHYTDKSFINPILFETSLYFTFGPNVNAVGRDANLGTMARTLVSGYNHDDPYHYYIFRECVKQSFKTSLEMMNNDGIQVPILCRVSGGIYSGVGTQTHTNINREYEAIINEIIQENPGKFNFVRIMLCL